MVKLIVERYQIKEELGAGGMGINEKTDKFQGEHMSESSL